MAASKKLHNSKTPRFRSSCTNCGRKLAREKLIEIYYPLLKKSAFHCQECMSANADHLHFDLRQKEPYLIELFSGSKTVSKVAQSHGFKTFTVDIESKFSPSLVSDISKMRFDQLPRPSSCAIIWASLPCTFYSILNISTHWQKITYAHRKYFYLPKTAEAIKALQLLEKTLWLIRKVNPLYYFIENPRGALRHMAPIRAVPFRHSITYSDFGLDVYKPTDIFTNCPFLQLPQLSRTLDRSFSLKIADMNSAYERSIVPERLIESIIQQITSHHPGLNLNSQSSGPSISFFHLNNKQSCKI